MIASVVLAFCVVGVCGALIAAMDSNRACESQTVAAEVARLNMDSLAAMRLEEISPENGNGSSEDLDDSVLAGSDSVAASGRLRYISRHPTQASRDLALIAVTATAADGQRVTLYRLATRTEMP